MQRGLQTGVVQGVFFLRQSAMKYTSENFLLHNPSDEIALPLLSSGGGLSLILPVSSDFGGATRYGMVTA
jgi:hypothetical protein